MKKNIIIYMMIFLNSFVFATGHQENSRVKNLNKKNKEGEETLSFPKERILIKYKEDSQLLKTLNKQFSSSQASTSLLSDDIGKKIYKISLRHSFS